MKKALNFFEAKIEYTYEPIADIFIEISNNIKKGVVEYITSLNYHKLDSPNIEVYHTDFIEIMIPIC